MAHCRRYAAVAIALLAWPLLCLPVDALEVPATVEPYRLVRINHRPDAWVLIDPVSDEVEVDVASASDSLTVFVGPPGRYRIRELYVDDGRHVSNQSYVTISGGLSPGPPTPPEPQPPEPDTPLPPSKYGVGPAVARGWSKGVTAEERSKAADIFQDVATRLEQRTIPTVQDGVSAITQGLRELNTKNQLQSGYGNYVEIMQKAFDGGHVRTIGDYAGAYREIADWLRK